MSDDIETKVSALLDIFSLFDKETVKKVLKDNNNDFESAAAVLSEMEAPKQTKPIVTPPTQRPVYQPPHQPANNPTTTNKPSQQQVVQQVKDLMGGAKFDVNQSTIFDVYQATGGNVTQTVQALKSLGAPDPALEEQKRAYERLEREKLQLLNASKEKEKRLLMEKERMQKEKIERERLEKELIERERLEKELLERERQEKELLRHYELQNQAKKAAELEKKYQMEQLMAMEREKERMEKERAEKERLQKQELLEREYFEKEKQRLEAEKRDLSLELANQRENIMRMEKQMLVDEQARTFERYDKEREERLRLEKAQLEIESKSLELEKERKALEKERLEREALQAKLKEEKDLLAREHEEKLLRERMERMTIEAELLAKQEAQLKALTDEQRAMEASYKEQLEEIQRLKEESIRNLENEIKIREQRESELSKLANQSITLSLRVEQLNEIVVSYDLAGQVHTSCWIGIFPTHQPKHHRYLTYQTITNKQGEVSFPGIIPGHYEARIFANKYDLLSTSASVKIGPTVKLTAHVLGDEIHVTYKVEPPAVSSTSDWIGLYTKDSRNKNYIDNVYANAYGTAIFKSPRVPAQYQVRYFVSPTKYNEQAVSTFEIVDMDKIEVLTPIVSKGDEIKVEYSVNTVQPSSSDWIGLFNLGDENNKNYLYSTYTNGTGNGILTFIAPDKPGNYEVRFFSYSKGRYTTFKTSNKFVITP